MLISASALRVIQSAMATCADFNEATEEITEAMSLLLTESSSSATGPPVANCLPYDALEPIFDLLSLRDLLSCAGVCQRWRQHVAASPRWRSFQFGQNIGCHVKESTTDYIVFLSQGEVVMLSAATPLYLLSNETRAIAHVDRIRTVPMAPLHALLRNSQSLRELDLSAMPLPDGATRHAFEKLWSRGKINSNELRSFALPRNYAPSCGLLKEILITHPSLKNLAISIDSSDYEYSIIYKWHRRERPVTPVAHVTRLVRQLAFSCQLKNLLIRLDESESALTAMEDIWTDGWMRSVTDRLRGLESLSIVGFGRGSAVPSYICTPEKYEYDYGPDVFDGVDQMKFMDLGKIAPPRTRGFPAF